MERHEKRIACVLSLEAKTPLICINAKKIRKCLRWGGGVSTKAEFCKKKAKRISKCDFFTFSERDSNCEFYKSLNLAYLFSTACFSCCVPCVVPST